jgi:hypothetical protein
MIQAFNPATLERSGQASSIAGPVMGAKLMNAAVETADFSVSGPTLAYRPASNPMSGLVSIQQNPIGSEIRGITILRDWAP